MDGIPKPSIVHRVIKKKKYSEKEIILYKLYIDIYAHIIKKLEDPVFDKYINEILPLALTFYENLKDEEFREATE